MKSAVIAVDSNAQQIDPQRPAESAGPDPTPVRFTYPSGSRPLEGYTIKRGIGHGGFGEVYYAISDAGKEVALKLIRRNLDVELRGIRHCLNLKHPDLLSVHDIRQDQQGDNWVVMEYITGECLENVIAAYPKGMPLEEALSWIHGIGAGVAYLHDHGIVHRDLKPGNIFSDEGMVKIGDYGLSKFISCSRRSGQTESIGTVHYMAPEVANGRYGKEIDIYALGVIFYEMLTGQLPFEGESVGEVLMKHLTAEPDLSRLEEPYRSVVGRALAKDPEKRFRTVGEMLEGLPQPAQSRVNSAPLPSGHGPRRRRMPVGAAAPVMAALVEEDDPVWRGVRQLWQRGVDEFNRAKLNTPTKIVVLVAALIVLLSTSPWWFPVVMLLAIGYGVYRLVRLIAQNAKTPPPIPVAAPPPPPPMPAEVARPAAASPEAERPETAPPEANHWRRRHEQAAETLGLRSWRERVAELLGSMVGGALVALTMCLVMVIVNSFRSTLPEPELCAWLGLMSIAGTWAVMIPAKLWEGTEGETIVRRFVLMVIGLALGVAAFASASYLEVTLPYDSRFLETHGYQLPAAFYSEGQPRLMAYLAVFGTLLALARWWRQADPLRRARLSLGAVIVSVVVAGVAAYVWVFPQPWLMIVAATMSVSLQLASPWRSPRPRHADNRRR